MAEICVVVGVFNAEKYLARSLDSIIAQTFTDYEVILVDDGSTDRSGRICDEYAEKDTRFHVIHQENGGAAVSRNTGIEWALNKGSFKWISIIDDDDYAHPLYLEALYKANKQWGTGIAIADYIISTGEELPKLTEWTSNRYRTEDYYLNHMLGCTVQWGKLISIDHFSDLRFPPGKLHEDEYIMYQVLFREKYVAGIDQALYAYFQHDQSIMHGQWNVRQLEVLEAIENQTDYFIERGFLKIAQKRFYYLVNRLSEGQMNVLDSQDLSKEMKDGIIKRLKRELRRVLHKYWNYHWTAQKEFRWKKRIYGRAFLSNGTYQFAKKVFHMIRCDRQTAGKK